MPGNFSPVTYLHYLLKREATQFFTAISIRNLALGMVLIFEPIYIYLFFGHSLPSTMLFFGAIYGLYSLVVVVGAKVMSSIGSKHSILLSHLFFFGYYVSLFYLHYYFLLVALAIVLKAVGMALFWPSFHVDFCKFSETTHQSREVGKLNIAYTAPSIVSPVIGGWILSVFGYPVLFVIVLVVLLASAIPMFLSNEVHIAYTDSLKGAWARIFKKRNRKIGLGFVFNSLEYGTTLYLWPLFMFILAISYDSMGGIITFSIALSTLFMVYLGRASDRIVDRIRFLNIGSVLTSISWVLKFFVVTPFSAFLAHAFYRICRTTASIPYQSLMYERATLKGSETDEFIVYREIIANVTRSLFFFALAAFFMFVPLVKWTFLMAAAFSLGLMFMGVPPKFMRLKKSRS